MHAERTACGLRRLAESEESDMARRNTSKRRYGPKAIQLVERAMHERKRGSLRSGGSGKKVTSRKQAIAIALDQARRAGAKVPPRKRARTRR
jgi:hypothetical protein